jgi:chemotaxis family two-component system response regulator Rcp1
MTELTAPLPSRPASNRAVQILLVEDSPSDVALTVSALRDGRITNDVHVARDGEQAMAFLQKMAPYEDAPTPDLVLLDLNLPRKDGREVLAEMKSDPRLRVIPVVVLTTSTAGMDIKRAYEGHANAFVSKPVDFEEFLAAIRGIEEFWLALVRLPHHPDQP